MEGEGSKASLLQNGEGFANTPINFKNVSLTILGKKVLKDVKFKASAGDTVAMIGEPGSGKHTIVNIMLAHYFSDPTAKGSSVVLYGSRV